MQSIEAYQIQIEAISPTQLVETYTQLVKKIALYLKKKLPVSVALEDLFQSGIVGLLEAQRTYSSDKGASFETYAGLRIKGAMLDAVRKSSNLPKDIAKKIREFQLIFTKLEQTLQRKPQAKEIASALKIEINEYYKMVHVMQFAQTLSWEEQEDYISIASHRDDNPETLVLQKDLQGALKDFLKKLPEKEQLVLSLYYVEELTFKKIGEMLGLSEARICQLHAQAITQVKKMMGIL